MVLLEDIILSILAGLAGVLIILVLSRRKMEKKDSVKEAVEKKMRRKQ